MSLPAQNWKRGAVKNCAHCNNEIRPRSWESRTNWAMRRYCGAECRSAHNENLAKIKRAKGRMYLPVGTPLDPAEMHSPGQRLRWLRVSYSTCGRKTPWTTGMLAEKTAALPDRDALSVCIIEDLERGKMRKLKAERTETACIALGVPVEILTVSQKKFVAVVKRAGLLAKTINNQKIDNVHI